ncbi:histidine-phosphotransfer domain, HPT domain-containing protein [Gonapodya prolifera JEL478]|uniref:Histidine-phosphotransfer domain, HPT domain-containing protein n=1 Tax=Gonapodya prolifera (strain JEL478) TaxID=1344416 RepID=A0A139A042_GONPJ|nr:histidine-phosphotransfer domain, HPT domain-containing protein [Gonapodya prolifera JEL478]|eukprot:KXS10147.1 histidine-phosphotransfer domain, HPT domain-containing protein [Gonapodya prolifera JEL478]
MLENSRLRHSNALKYGVTLMWNRITDSAMNRVDTLRLSFHHMTTKAKPTPSPENSDRDEDSYSDEDGDDQEGAFPSVDTSIIDETFFYQLLGMDEDEKERECSSGIVLSFFEQARTKFAEMEQELWKADIEAIGKMGHFLKSSAAYVGLKTVRASCEELQHLGKLTNNDQPVTKEKALKIAKDIIERAKGELVEAQGELSRFYEFD